MRTLKPMMLLLATMGFASSSFSEGLQAQPTIPAKANAPALSIGTLIYTAAERDAMMGKSVSAEQATEPTRPSDSEFRVDGFVRPFSGRPVIWINGEVNNDRVELGQGDNQVIVRINQSRLERLAPGQSTRQSEFGTDNSVIIHRAQPPTNYRAQAPTGTSASREKSRQQFEFKSK